MTEQRIDVMGLGERLGALDAAQKQMLDDIKEIKSAVSDLQKDFSAHIVEDRTTADRISRIETSIQNIESVTNSIADKHRDAMRLASALKWALVAVASSIGFFFTAYDHLKEYIHK